MSIDFKRDVLAPINNDFIAMDQLIQQGIDSKVSLVMSVSKYVIDAGGKRMRPAMSLLASRLCHDQQSIPAQQFAAIIEMLHTATLVHDDVVDESALRRGRPTANVTWDNQTAVLVGDYLIAKAFDLLVQLDNMPLLSMFSKGTCHIAEAEVLQLECKHQPKLTEETYFEVIRGKTSKLFELSVEGAALVTNQPQYQADLGRFAMHFGNAFQIIDDILDYTSDAATLGKNVGDDLIEGKVTLPLIATLERIKGADQELLAHSILTGGQDQLERIIQLVQQSGGISYCQQRAEQETQAAIAALHQLPANPYRDGLENLTKLALSRIA